MHLRPARPRNAPAIAVIVVAAVLQLLVAIPYTAAMGLLAPGWAIGVGWAMWLAGVTALVLLAQRRPKLTPLVPLVNAALLFAFVTFGDVVLGWTA